MSIEVSDVMALEYQSSISLTLSEPVGLVSILGCIFSWYDTIVGVLQLLGTPSNGRRTGCGPITRDELRAKIEGGDEFVLVDVLDDTYYRQSHLPGAINIPLENIGRAEEEVPDRDADIVVYCMNGM